MDLTIEMEFLIHTRSKAGVHPNYLPPGWICPRISKLNGFAVGVSVHLMVSLSVSDQKTPAPLETLPVPSASTPPAHPRVDRDVPTAATVQASASQHGPGV